MNDQLICKGAFGDGKETEIGLSIRSDVISPTCEFLNSQGRCTNFPTDKLLAHTRCKFRQALDRRLSRTEIRKSSILTGTCHGYNGVDRPAYIALVQIGGTKTNFCSAITAGRCGLRPDGHRSIGPTFLRWCYIQCPGVPIPDGVEPPSLKS